ncbi:MAG: hypothetical protein KatS3mg023_1175 [Armatimonadota bacterium]|nr:MAG: hypothetical protein KatS3mg023_1175 [Armatimonadota bacterium]
MSGSCSCLSDHVRPVVAQPDGLTASEAGVTHGVIVRVPVSLMVTPGEYLFVVHAVDDHPDEEKCYCKDGSVYWVEIEEREQSRQYLRLMMAPVPQSIR